MDTATPATSVQLIPVGQLQPNPWNRTVFDPAQMQELVESIRSGGIKEPLIVRQGSEGYQIASGHRRWMAAKEAGLAEVPCYVQALTDDQVAEDNITINLQREGIPSLELARMVNDYILKFDKTQEEAAAKFGKSKAWVSDLVGFLKIPAAVREKFSALNLAWDQLMALRKATVEVQTQVAQELQEGKLKPEGMEKRCRQLKFGAAASPATSPKPDSPSPVPIPDPLADLWPSLHETLHMPPNEWKISFEAPYTWVFRASPISQFNLADGPKGVQKALAAWLRNMAAAMDGPA
jgi:ParB family chromosome partitioning protein